MTIQTLLSLPKDELRVMVAECAGIKKREHHAFEGMDDNRYFQCNYCGKTQGWRDYCKINKHPDGPCCNVKDDYPNSLDAMAPLEAALNDDEQNRYVNHISDIIDPFSEVTDFELTTAPAYHRAVAYVACGCG